MEILFDETYSSKDGKHTSRNIWYGYADISVDDEYGKIIRPTEEFIDTLCKLIKNDLTQDASPTETNWYFYGSSVSKDAIGENIRPVIMVREKNGDYAVNISISDYDFAINIDAILLFKNNLLIRLTQQ